MKRHLLFTGIATLFIATGAALPAKSRFDESQFMTGAEPVSPQVYAKLPKQGRFRAYLPKRVDLSNAYPPPGSQGPQPNCVAWATTYAARTFLNFRDRDVQPAQPADQMSPAYVYNRLRPAGTPCTGTISIVQALELLKNEGTVTLADFPDDMTRCAIPAGEELRGKAGHYRLLDWRAIDREVKDDWRTPLVLDDVKGALARGAPVIFAMPAPVDFKAWRGDGIYRRSERPDKANWHAMAIVGYDEDRQALRIMNSWGPTWGDKGYAWIDYASFRLLTGEAYSLEAPSTPAGAPVAPPPARTDAQILADQVAAMPCGRVAVNGHDVSGFSGDAAAIEALRAAALRADPQARVAVRHLPWPQCEAVLTLAAPLERPGVTLSALTPDGAARAGDPVALRDGDLFGVRASGSAALPYLSIFYLQADGSAVELHRGRFTDGEGDVTIGLSRTQQRYAVAPPYGDEMIVALASAGPLFADGEKIDGTERQFLTRLRARLIGRDGDGVAASVVRLKTSGPDAVALK